MTGISCFQLFFMDDKGEREDLPNAEDLILDGKPFKMHGKEVLLNA